MARLTGNVYVDSSYTAEITGSTHPITGETLEFGVNAFASGGTTSNVPVEGGTIFYNNVDRLGSSIYNDGTYDAVFINTRSNYLYAVPKKNDQQYVRDIKIYVEGGTHQHLSLLGRGSNVTLIGDLSFTATNTNFGGSNDNIGGGESNDNANLILGDIDFTITDSVSGGSLYVQCGTVGSAEQKCKINGKLVNFISTAALRGVRTGANQNIYADFNIEITGSSFGNDIEFGYPLADQTNTWEGNFVMTVTATTAANIYAYGRADATQRPLGTNTFTLNVAAAEAATLTAGSVDKFDTINVATGATLQAASINNAVTLTVNKGADVVAGTLSGIQTLAIVGEFTDVNNTIIRGLTAYEDSNIAKVTLNGEEIEYGFMPGQYSVVGDKLILHQGETVLVNSTFTDGQTVTYGGKELIGYKSVASAQEVVSADEKMITVVPADGSSIDADIVTKNYGVVIQGSDSNKIDMGGKNLVIGEAGVKQPSATVVINGLSSVGTMSFGDLDATFVTAEGLEANAIDLRNAAIGDADISLGTVTATDVYLPNKSVVGTLNISGGKIENIYNSADSDGKLVLGLDSKTTVENVYAEGKSVDVGDASVSSFFAGLKDGGDVDAIAFSAKKKATITNLVLGGDVAANTIGSLDAEIGASGISKVTVGGDNDTITGDANVVLSGPVGIEAPGSGTFTGIVYGADIADVLDGNSDAVGGKSNLSVTGHAKVGSITGFDTIAVTGGTLNVTGDIDGESAIVNRRTISAKNIEGDSLENTGAIGASELTINTSFVNAGIIRVESLKVDGSFDNSNTIHVEGSIEVGGLFTNSGVIYTGNANGETLSLDGGDLVNTGSIYTGSLKDVNNLTTSTLYVADTGTVSGDITVTADSRVAFLNGLEFSGNVTIDESSILIVGGSSFEGSGTITINVGDLIGSNEVVRANGGLNSWTIKTAGANAGNYQIAKTDTSIVVYSTDQLFVNSGFSADADIIVDGNTLLYGKNAFSTVAEAVAAAKSGAQIVIVGDKTGMDVNAGSFDVVLDDAEVGTVTTSKGVFVSSDSKAKSIASASGLTIDAGALLSVAETIPANLPITIDASEGSGSRLVLDVDKTKVALSADQVTIIGKDTYQKLVLEGEATHAGDLYLISSDNSFFAPDLYEEVMEDVPVVDGEGNPVLDDNGNPVTEKKGTGVMVPTFVDGDTFDKATGDALFDTVNTFLKKSDATDAAKAASGTLVIVRRMATTDNEYGSPDVTTLFEVTGPGDGAPSVYGGANGNPFTFTDDHTVMVVDSNHRGNLYSLSKVVNLSKDYTYTFIAKDAVLTGGDRNAYVVSSDQASKIEGNVYADISGSTFANNFYVGFGSFGTDETAPIDVEVNISKSRFNHFYAFEPSNDANVKPVINANISITLLDSVITDAFYAFHTGDWRGDDNVTLRYTAFNSGSLTVTFGGSTFGSYNASNNSPTGGQLHGGDSVTHGRNALQNFNVPTTLHIVKGETSERTTANWVMEWDTIIVDANATLWANMDIQFLSGDVNSGRLPNSGTPAMIKINMADFQGGTRVVVRAANIYATGETGNRPGIQIIGDEDISDQYEVILVDNNNTLTQIGVYDKASDVYLNSTYSDSTSGTFAGDQVLYFDKNALNDAAQAAALTGEWGSGLYVTGGNFTDAVTFGGSKAFVQGDATLLSLTGEGDQADVSITVDANTSIGSIVAASGAVSGNLDVVLNGAGKAATAIDGVKDSVAGKATLDVKGANTLGNVSNFDEVKLTKGAEVTFGALTNASLSVFADNSIFADSVTLGSDIITIDVTDYEGGPRALLTTVNGITDFDASKVKFVVAEGSTSSTEGFSVVYNDNILTLKTSKQTDVYLNSTYSAETTGSFYDGVYLEYGFNAFSTFAEAVANVGEGYSVIMTGGESAESITVDGVNFVMKGGTLGKIKGGETASVLTVDGTATVTNGIEDIAGLTMYASGKLTADHIDLTDGSSILIKAADFKFEEGNLHKVIDTVTGISGTTTFNGEGFYVFYQNNDLYVLDKSRIYVDPTYTSEITGTTAFTGDTLIFGVNAFAVAADTNLANAADVNNALVTGGTLFVLNWTRDGQAGDIRPAKDVSIYTQGKTNYSIVFGNNGGNGHVVDGDYTITVDNTSTPQANTAFIHSGDNNNRWTFNGNVTVNFVGEGQVNTNTAFAVTKRVKLGKGATFTLNIDGKRIENDVTFFRQVANGDFNDAEKITINFNNVYGPNDKWIRLFSNNDNTDGSFGNTDLTIKDVEMNITNSWFRSDNNQNWSISLVNGDAGSRNTNFTIHLSGATVDGLISGVRNRAQNSPGNGSVYNGNRTVYVDDGYNRLARLIMINHIVIDGNASLVLTDRQGSYGNNVPYALHFIESNPSGKNSITIDLSDYEGADKMFITAPRMGIAQRDLTAEEVDLVVTGDTESKFIAGIGLTHGVYIITKNGDVLYNSAITSADNGTAFSDTFVNVDEINPDNTNAFKDFEAAKDAFDTREAVNPGRKLYVSGNGEAPFYADGYAVTIIGGTYENAYGTDDENATVDSVSMTVTGGQFFGLAVSDGTGEVTKDATLEIAGGKFGTPATYTKPENPDDEPEIDEPAVLATIDGSNSKVGGVSTLILSKDLVADTTKDGETIVNADITGSIANFDSVVVGKGVANMAISDDLTADAITIDASSQLTVLGTLTAATITIEATEYVGPSKVIAISDAFKTAAGQPAVTVNGDPETYDYKYVEDTLYLVSKHAGNVYLNSTWNESISGTIYNGELLVWGVNAIASMDEAVLKLTDDYTLYITGGQFDGTYTFSGQAKIDIRDDAATIGGLVLGDGSSVTISGLTSGNANIGSIVAVEGYTTGLNLNVNSDATFGTLSDIRSISITAGKTITADTITYRENGGYFNVDFKGYTAGTATLLQTTNGINNYLQYNETLADGTTVSRNVMGTSNNDAKMMPYYDEAKKAVVAVEPGAFAFLDPNASNADNGEVVTIDGQTTTKVYGFNLSNWNVNSGRFTISGGTLFADGGETGAFYWFFTAEPVNVHITGLTCGGGIAGYNVDENDPVGHTRDGEFTAYVEGSSFGWFTSFAGQGTSAQHQTFIVANRVADDPDDPESGFHYEDTQWNLTFKGGTHDTNDFQITNYGNITGGTVNVTFEDYRMAGDLQLFHRVYNVDGESLKEVNLVLKNVSAPAAKWLCMWDPRENTDTKLTITVTDSTFIGTDHTLGFINNSTEGGWSGEGEVYISGFTMQGRLSGARGRNDQGNIDNITGVRTLFVDGENYVRVVRDFTTIDVAKTAGLLRTESVNLSEGSDIILRGDTDYKDGAKEFIVASSTVSGILPESAQFLDDDDNAIDGYAAVVGNTNVFVYALDGDVYYSNLYSAQTTGTAIVEADGTKNFLVFGDNAVSSMNAAAASVDARTNATIYVLSSVSKSFDTRGYKIVFDGGQITNVWGGLKGDAEEAQTAVDSANITVNSGATVTNIVAGAELAQVSGDVSITIGDGTAILGKIDGAPDYVGGESFLTFEGSATVKGDVLGFKTITVEADEIVEVGGAVSNSAITIDTTGYENATKIVMTSALGFADDVTVAVGTGFDYKFTDDRKALLVVSDMVGDAFFNTDWTEESVKGLFVGGVELVWNKNAFNNLTSAVGAAGAGFSVVMDGGASTEDADLAGRDFVAGGTAIGSITSVGATITVTNDLTAVGLSGFAAIDMASGATITATGALAFAENATLTVDVTGYTQEADDVIIISAAGGITNLSTANITVVGEGANNYGAYYDAEDGAVHMAKLSNKYFSTAFNETDTQGVKDVTTGEILFFGKNAFNTLTPALETVVEGATVFAYDCNGTINPTSTTPINLHLIGGTVSSLRILSGDGLTTQVNAPITLTVEGTVLTGDMENIIGHGSTWTGYADSLSYFKPVTINLTGGTNTGNIRFVGQWASILGNITLNLTDWTLLGDIKPFAGDSRHGSNDTGPSKIVWNWENVSLPVTKWIAIADITDWGADKVGADGVSRQSMDAIEFTLKNSNLIGGSRICALSDGNDGRHNSNTDITFTVEDSYIDARLSTTMTQNFTNSTAGVKTLNITGTSSFIQWANWFQTLNIASADTILSGGTVTFEGTGVINVDATGYTGGSKVLVSLTEGFQQSDTSKEVEVNLVQDEGATYELVYGKKGLVLKSNEIKNVYVNSTYSTDIIGSVYEATGEALIFNTNAFNNVPDALAVLPAEGSIYVTGGSLEAAAALPSNNLTIDAGATLTYKGGVAITITDAFVNEGTLTVSTEGFDLSGGKTVALTAGTISGAGNYKVIGDTRYLLTKEENTLYFIERKLDVFVNTSWEGKESGDIVTLLSGETATIGIDAFASADPAQANVFGGGTITIEAGDIAFTNRVSCSVKALSGVTVKATLDDKGILVVNEGATAHDMAVREGGTLTVESGAILTGSLGLANGSTITVNGTLDFNLSTVTAGSDALVNNLALVGGTPTYTITIDAAQKDGTYALAGNAAAFTITGEIALKTVSSEIVKFTELGKTEFKDGIQYTLNVNEKGELTFTKEVYVAPITVTYVNSEWAGTADGTVVATGATFGYNAFATGDEGIAKVVDYGEVKVLGGTVSFTDAIAKTVTISSAATLIGNATFTTAITIDGTVAFDTQYAADGAQFNGFQYVSGAAKYTLNADAVAGTWTLASDAAGFNSDITFGDYTLKLGEETVIGDFAYTVSIVDMNGDLILSVANYVPPTPTTPTQTYANSEWTGKADGEVVTVTGGTAVIGYDAFATLAAAIAGVTEDGKINVTGGTVAFADGYSKTITVDAGATVVGKAAFDKAITVNGTFAFDTANASATAAQFGGFSNVAGKATYTLTDAAATKGTYLLASDAAGFNSDVQFGTYTLQVGVDVLVNDSLVYTLGITDNNDLALTIADKPTPPPTPTYIAKGDRDGNGVSDVMFVWTERWDEETQSYVTGNYAHGYWMNGTNTWWSANAYWISPEWDNLGSYDMSGDGKADAVMFGNVTTEAGIKGAYIGYYQDGDDMNGWVTIGYLENWDNIQWQNKVGNLTGNTSGANSIVWYAPEMYAIGAWLDGKEEWADLSHDFGGSEWTLVGCGDFTGTGKDSALMSYNNGQMFYSVGLDGVAHSHGSANWSGWEVRAIGDFAGDGKDDIVLFHKDSGSMVMFVDGNGDDYKSIGQLDAGDWFVVGAGDYNGDQKDELLVRQYSTGMLGYYTDGVQSVENWNVLGYGVGMEWTVIA